MNELTVERIKQRAGEFDIEGVTTLSFVGLSLRSIAPVAACSSLTELDVSGNALSSLDALRGLEQLATLIASANRVEHLEPLRTLPALRTLRLDGNAVSNLDEVQHMSALPELRAVYFRKVFEQAVAPNPICGHPAYRPTVMRLVPELANLDGERLRAESGPHAEALYEPSAAGLEEPAPLEPPAITPVFAKADIEGFRAALADAAAADPAAGREVDAALRGSEALVARAHAMVRELAER